MPYVPKRHAQWIGLVELVELVKTESGCSLEAAHDQIRNALAEGAICPLDWEPAPAASWLCQVRYGSPHHIYRMPLYPPPLPPEICPCFIDARRALHWQDV